MKIKEKFKSLMEKVKNSTKSFPLTIISIMFLSLFFAINLKNNFFSSNTVNKITIFVLTFSCGTLFIESLKNSKFRIVGYIISIIIAGVFTNIDKINPETLGLTTKIFEFRILKVYYSYLATVIILSIYFNYKKSEKSFSEYLASVFVNLFQTSLIYGILALGIAAIIGVFIFLILDGGNGYTFIGRVEIILVGFYYVPNLIYCFYKQEKVGKFGKVVIKYVLNTLVIAAFIVIYMYMIKIIILRDIPSNQIFRIIASLFSVGMPVWTMSMYFNEEKLLDKLNRKLPILFIPFIFLEIYSIAVRINENGITPLRYICIMLILFEIIYIVIYLINKEKIGNILIVTIFMTIISAVFPYINMFNISNVSQYARFEKNYYNSSNTKKREFSDDEIEIIYSTYNYLANKSVEGDKFLSSLSEEDIDEIIDLKRNLNIDSNESVENSYKYYYGSKVIRTINTEGYNNLYKISDNDYDTNILISDFENLIFTVKISDNEEKSFDIDLSAFVKEFIENYEVDSNYFKNNNEIIINSNQKIILESISIKYNNQTKTIYSYNVEGYLLEK